MAEKVIMPQLGESVVEGTLVKWLVKVGDKIEEFDSIIEVESAKVNTEIPSPATGTLLKTLVEEGITVKAGTILAWIGDPGEEIPSDENDLGETDVEATQPVKEKELPSSVEEIKTEKVKERDLGFISPVVAKLAQEHEVDLNLVKGTGNNRRITKKDVLDFIKNGAKEEDNDAPAWETPGEGDLFRPTEMQFPDRFKANQPEARKNDKTVLPPVTKDQKTTGDQVIPLSSMRKAIATHMVMSKQTSPHVTTVMESDMQNVSKHREKNKDAFSNQGYRLTYTSYFVAATAIALRAFPLVNSSWTENGILMKNAINIGLATSLEEEGLIVPVIKNSDSFSLSGLARAIEDLVQRARNHQLKPDEVQGGTFSITNHGTAGSLFASPVINQPQAGILGVGTIKKRVVVINDAIAIRPMVYLSFTFDHRILDGSTADNFLAKIVSVLENWQ
ncbi:MAG TPA: dihydrolipoamide acetyltransferase family protein [Anaerolineaceae bacterium]|nr:dihydrolipoamide acetyltransferase family protein [Anaerolineaceae bacterium]